MPYNPSLPQDNTPVDAPQMRSQLTGLQALINDAVANSSANSNGVPFNGTDITDPPTQEQVQSVQQTLNELIAALRR